jgi:integrase/recombinase XerD
MIEEVPSFLFHCEIEKKLTEKTLKAYQTDLSQFSKFLQQHQIELVQKEELKKYLLELSKYSSRTMKRKVATLKAFYSYLEFEEKIEANPFRKVRVNIKLEQLLPETLTISEISAILKVAYLERLRVKDKKSYAYKEKTRNVAIIELLVASGMRVSELCSLRSYNVSVDFSSVKIMGKGKKERIIPITNAATQKALEENFQLFKEQIETTSFVFINRFGRGLSEQSVRFMVKHYAMLANIQRKVTPHLFRHSFATLLLEGDVDIRYIQHLLGHSSINVTQIYAHVNEKKKKELLRLKSPRNLMQV